MQHQHTKTAGRHLAYIPLGAAVVVKRLWDSRTTTRYERMSSAPPRLRATTRPPWSGRSAAAEFRKDSHGRRVDMVKVPVEVR